MSCSSSFFSFNFFTIIRVTFRGGMDEWDLLDEVDVIALWPSEHKKNVESAKWQERKESLEVRCLCSLP